MITEIYISELEIEFKDMQIKLHYAKCEFAEQECPHKVGDEVIVNGCSHSGKKIIVDSILPAKYSWEGNWKCVGDVLRKDGTKSSFRGQFTGK